MEIAIVIIVVIAGVIITAVKIRRIFAGRDGGCSCAENCPFAGDLTKCTGYKNTCGYSEKKDSKNTNR